MLPDVKTTEECFNKKPMGENWSTNSLSFVLMSWKDKSGSLKKTVTLKMWVLKKELQCKESKNMGGDQN